MSRTVCRSSIPAAWEAVVMGKQRIKPNYRRRVLRLPDLDHCKTAVLNSLGSPASRRVYEYAIDQFNASAESHPANRRDFFNTHACFRQLSGFPHQTDDVPACLRRNCFSASSLKILLSDFASIRSFSSADLSPRFPSPQMAFTANALQSSKLR